MLIMKEENTQKADEIRFALKNTIRDGGSTSYTVNMVDPCTFHIPAFPLFLTLKQSQAGLWIIKNFE